MGKNEEQTFIMVKPDGVQRGLINKVVERFEQRGYKLIAMKMTKASKSLLEEHYKDLSSKPFFNGLVEFMASSPVVAMVWQGLDVVRQGRIMLGETKPGDSKPGSLRGDYCVDVARNLVHGSDSITTALQEINLWFNEEELCDWTPATSTWIYE